MLLKVIKVKNALSIVNDILIMGSNLKFRLNSCNDLTMLCLNPRYVTIIIVKAIGYCCIIHGMNKSEINHLL